MHCLVWKSLAEVIVDFLDGTPKITDCPVFSKLFCHHSWNLTIKRGWQSQLDPNLILLTEIFQLPPKQQRLGTHLSILLSSAEQHFCSSRNPAQARLEPRSTPNFIPVKLPLEPDKKNKENQPQGVPTCAEVLLSFSRPFSRRSIFAFSSLSLLSSRLW